MATTKGKPRVRARESTFEFESAVADPAADQGFHFSGDGRRAIGSAANVAPQKRPKGGFLDEADPYVDWVEAPEASGDFANIASTLSSYDTFEHVGAEDEGKRKRYESSDDPMKLWRRDKHVFLDHLVRHDGLGDDHAGPTCLLCHAPYGSTTRIFRCEPCGQFLQCEGCLEERHRLQPLHPIKEWTGKFWAPAALHETHIGDKSSRSLHGVYQLGHHGQPCVNPASAEPQTMVILDVRGIFTLRVRFCKCAKAANQNKIAQLMGNGWYPATTIDPATCATFDALETFRQLNVVGNLSAHDYVGTLERLTDPTRLGSTPDRYKAFSRMSRQYQFLKRGKRAGVAHDMAEMEKVKPGDLAVRCWACPQDGFNLPDGWDSCNPDDEYLYCLMLALDANFRLKNRIRSNEKHDPSLGPGWGCFVESEAYKDHLRDYVAESDVSTCIAFAALMEKETRLTTGLRVSGVGGCVCGRHGVVRAQGLGDLQKGERYANMDYIFLHAIADARVKRTLLSYDIACQWKLRLRERVQNFADNAGIPDLAKFRIQFGLPVWHAAAHKVSCQASMSLSHAAGVGRTDGEGIERTWATLNPISFATKEMGEGNRLDSIEDKVDHIGFEKNVGQGGTLARKLVIAVAERDKQINEFVEIDRGLEPDLRREWQQLVTDWVADPSKRNPYVMSGGRDAGPTEAQVAAELKQAELEEIRQGRGEGLEGRTTTTGFVKGLLQLEDLQRRIRHETRGKTLSAERLSQIEELRASVFKKLKVIRREQEVFMSGVSCLRTNAEEGRDRDLPPPKAEDLKLWFPSDLTETQRTWACGGRVVAAEAKLREAQCGDALVKVRGYIYMKTHLIHTRNETAVGQAASTRSRTLIERVGERMDREMTKYNQARKALGRLKGEDYAPHLKELKKEDLHVRAETESDARARIRLGRLSAERRGRNEPSATTAEGGKGISWIWSTVRQEDDAVGLHEAVRVHWAKTLARRDRWVEEVRLLGEERKRVLRSLWSVQEEWRARVSRKTTVEPRLASGLAAYAERQVAVHRAIAEEFYNTWHVKTKAALKQVLGQDREIHERLLRGEREVLGATEGSITELEGGPEVPEGSRDAG
ncbi:hypothetical protein C8F01DRAFT_1253971 [Mycena amicta]|nr:hypothetical protein C8F01DRAFT_1253971 [Mycena amicta]